MNFNLSSKKDRADVGGGRNEGLEYYPVKQNGEIKGSGERVAGPQIKAMVQSRGC